MDFEFEDNFEETPIEEFDDDSDDLGPVLPGSSAAFHLAANAKAARLKTARYREMQSLLSEAERRSKECVRLYTPSELQNIYHAARCKEALIAGGNQVGKEQPVSEPILTPHGWVKMGDLNVGDEVIARDGNPCKVTAVYPQGVKPVYRITFNDGSSTRCGLDHLWPTLIGARERYKNRDWKVRSLKDILERCGECPTEPSRPEIPVCSVTEFTKPHLPSTRAVRHLIDRIELVGEEESQCIAVDSDDHTYLTKDCIVTHNSLAGFMEDGRAMLGADPYKKYPKEDGILIIVGWDEGHLSRVVHRYLFESGIFRIFKNNDGNWESYKPWLHKGIIDKSRLEDSPPLIPSRFIDKIAWKNRAMNIFSQIRLKNGWVIHGFSSRSTPAQGFQLDLAHIDEDIQSRGWYEEITARASMRNGLIRWTALPHGKTDALKNLIDRAEKDENEFPDNPEKRTAIHVRINVFDNKYMEEETRQANIRIWRDEGEDIYRQRALGELVTDSSQVYPNFSKNLHDAFSETPHMSKARKIYIEGNGKIPQNWMRTMIVDPGHKLLAVVFIATPPPELGTERFAYGELAIQRATAPLFGNAVADFIRARRDSPCQKYIIDPHGGALTSLETGISPRRAYSRELGKHNVFCYETGFEFANGSDDINGRELLLRSWLSINPDTQEPTLFVDTKRCPNICRNFDRFIKKEVNGVVTDVSDRSGKIAHDHTDCLEYGAAHGLNYVAPPVPQRAKTHAEMILEGIQKRKQAAIARKAFSPEAMASQIGSISLGPRT